MQIEPCHHATVIIRATAHIGRDYATTPRSPARCRPHAGRHIVAASTVAVPTSCSEMARLAFIRQAKEAGLSERAIGDVLRMSHQRINQLAKS